MTTQHRCKQPSGVLASATVVQRMEGRGYGGGKGRGGGGAALAAHSAAAQHARQIVGGGGELYVAGDPACRGGRVLGHPVPVDAELRPSSGRALAAAGCLLSGAGVLAWQIVRYRPRLSAVTVFP